MNKEKSVIQQQGDLAFLESLSQKFEEFWKEVLPWLKKNPDRNFPSLLSFSSSDDKTSIVKLLPKSEEEFVLKLLERELQSNQRDRILNAVSFSEKWSFGGLLLPLIALLNSTDRAVFGAVLKAILALQGSGTLKELTAFFLACRDRDKLSVICKRLVGFGEKAGEIFLSAYPNASRAHRPWIVKILSELGYPQAVQIFSEVLANNPLDYGIFAIKGLGKAGTVETIQILSKHLKNPDWFLRKKIVEALGETNKKEAILPLLEALEDEFVQVRAGAIESLTKIGRFSPEELVKHLEKGGREKKICLIKVMEQIPERIFLAPLLKTLSDRSILFFSIDAIGELGCPEASTHLEVFLKDQDWSNRLNALEALAKLSPKNLAELAQSSLQDPDDMVRNAAARILKKNGALKQQTH